MSDDLVERLRLRFSCDQEVWDVLDRITELEAENEALRASREFWSASWSDEHTAHVLTSKRITELEAEVETLRSDLAMLGNVFWRVDLDDTYADAVRRALEGDDR